MSEEETERVQSDAPADSGTSGQSATGTGTAESTEDGQSAKSESDDAVSRAEFDRIRNQLSAADKRRQDAEDRLKALDDKDKSDLERTTERVKALETELQSLRTERQKLVLEKSLLADAEYGAHKWHDPEDVLSRLGRAIQDDEVTVADDGTPDAKSIKNFLKTLAEKRQYLVKSEDSKPAPGSSGAAVGAGSRAGESSRDADQKLRSKYRIR